MSSSNVEFHHLSLTKLGAHLRVGYVSLEHPSIRIESRQGLQVVGAKSYVAHDVTSDSPTSQPELSVSAAARRLFIAGGTSNGDPMFAWYEAGHTASCLRLWPFTDRAGLACHLGMRKSCEEVSQRRKVWREWFNEHLNP